MRCNRSVLDLGNISLWACVWTPSEDLIDRTFRAVRYCTTLAKFKEVVFFCCVDPRINDECGWRVVRVPRMDIPKWNVFVNREVPKHLTGAYSLSVHEDGFILDPSLWTNEFLQYDYVGAPWPDGVVGNQGFCLESRKMMQEKMSIPVRFDDCDTPSDNFVCIKHRSLLERKGVKFAPKELAYRFSTEQVGDEWPSFGFHGRTVAHRKYRRGWEQIEKSERQKFAVLTGNLPNYDCLGNVTINQNKKEYCERHGYDLILHREVRKRWSDPSSHASGFSWSRLEHMSELVASGDYDWVWVVGCDTLVTNMTITLDSIAAKADAPGVETIPFKRCPKFKDTTAPPQVVKWRPPNGHRTTGSKHVIACGERVTPIQADSFLVRGSQEGYSYLCDILSQYPHYKHHAWVENQAMIDLVEKHADKTLFVPQHVLNSYDYSCFYDLGNIYRDGIDCYGHRGQWKPGDFLIHWPGVSLDKRMELLQKYLPQVVR